MSQFAAGAKDELPLCSDKKTVLELVTSIPQLGGQTDTDAGFEHVEAMLQAGARPDTRGRTVILFTDGAATNSASAATAAGRLKEHANAKVSECPSNGFLGFTPRRTPSCRNSKT